MKKVGVILGLLLIVCSQAANAAVISLYDDDYEEVAIGFDFDFFGNTYSSVYINSNGSLTFGGGDTDFSESTYDFLNDDARIAVWDDFYPDNTNAIQTYSTGSSFTVSYTDVRQYGNNDDNSFSFVLYDSGMFEIELTDLNTTDVLVGITGGNGEADPGETDISASSSYVFNASSTMYELFQGDFDLANSTVLQFGNISTAAASSSVSAPSALALIALGMFLITRKKELTISSDKG